MNKDLHLRRYLHPSEKFYVVSVITIPFLAVIAFFAAQLHHNLHWFTLGLFLVCYCLTVFGITIGYHRLLTHRSFKANRVLKIVLTALGAMAYEGTPFFWVGAHRRHHKYSDKEGDPHSPLGGKHPVKDYFHSHLTWMITHKLEDWRYYIRDLLADKDLRFINKHYTLVAFSGLLIPAIINGLYYATWYAFFEGLLVCGLLRVFLQHHVTWSINSACHVFGRQDFIAPDNSRNNILFGILALGEGWHNGHHAFPTSARHGLLWWQIDVSYLMIKFFKLLGLASDIKVPTPEKLQEKINTKA